jgi:phosphoglycolate phosphatase
MARFSLVMFDLDGTLVDTAQDIASALNATLSEAGLASLATEVVIGYIGNGAAKLIERALPPASAADPRSDVAALVGRFKAHYAANVCEQSRVYPGITDLLERVGAQVPLAVLTNKPGDLARSLLKALGIDGWFAHIIGDGDGFQRKPAPDAARWLIAQHNLSPTAAILVGDGLPDIQVARATGCAVAAVTWGYTSPAALQAEAPTFVLATPTAVGDLIVDGRLID